MRTLGGERSSSCPTSSVIVQTLRGPWNVCIFSKRTSEAIAKRMKTRPEKRGGGGGGILASGSRNLNFTKGSGECNGGGGDRSSMHAYYMNRTILRRPSVSHYNTSTVTMVIAPFVLPGPALEAEAIGFTCNIVCMSCKGPRPNHMEVYKRKISFMSIVS